MPDRLPEKLERFYYLNPHACMQCLSCSNACIFSPLMDRLPNQIIRLLQWGFVDDALRSSAIWVCVECRACSSVCPASLDIPAMFDELKEEVLRRNIPVSSPDIFRFHREVLGSIKKYGRTHKFGIIAKFKIRTCDIFSDMMIGFKMLIRGKLDIIPDKVLFLNEIKKIFLKLGL